MSGILLDTHAFIWYVTGSKEISKSIQHKIDAAIQSYELYLAAISLWEISMLEMKQRIILEMPCLAWLNQAIKETSIQVLPITPMIAVESSNLPGNFHGDPADRLIVATARAHHISLLSRDVNIIQYGKSKHVTIVKL